MANFKTATTLYAFDRNAAPFTGLSAGTAVTTTITDGTSTFTDVRYADGNGYAFVEISTYLQALFTATNVDVTFTATKSATITCVAGGNYNTYSRTIIYGMTSFGFDYYDLNGSFVYADRNYGIWLRWLDMHGKWQYWQFCEGNEVYTDSVFGETIPIDTTNQFPMRYQGKQMAKQRRAIAHLVSNDTYRGLIQVCMSNHVSVYSVSDSDWIPCNIQAGTHTWSNEEKRPVLQDFDVMVIYPEYNLPRH